MALTSLVIPYGNEHNVCKLYSHAHQDLHHSVIVIHEQDAYETYETSPFIKNNFKIANTLILYKATYN